MIKETKIRSIRPEGLFDAIKGFDPRHATTRGAFSTDVPGLGKDMEWNHMDQMHRAFIHHTYQDNLRIAMGQNFAVSLTRWGKWPFLIVVTDTRIAEGIYYQNFVLAGMIFVHNTITMQEKDEVVHVKVEWTISSHRFLKPLHGILSRMFHRLNVRLQKEDSVIRSQRYLLRKQGYDFRSDPPDYYTSNQMTFNTLYPRLQEGARIDIDALQIHETVSCRAGNQEFLVRREKDEVMIWPSACPHEGGELAKGKYMEDCRIECPWHGMKISAARLSADMQSVEAYGFLYTLEGNTIHIRQAQTSGGQ